MSYPEQLAFKQRQAEMLLSKFGRVSKIIGMKNPFNYRNKVQAAFYFDFKRHRTVSGVYQSNSGKIIPIDYCMLEDRKADEIINTICRLADSFRIQPFDLRRGGFLRHVLIKRGFSSGQIMVVIVSASPVFPSRNNFVKALLRAHPDITTIVHNINPYGENLTLGDNSKVLYGDGYIEDTLCGCTFRISPSSFYQINPVQCETLYSKAIEFARLTGKESVLDAYCGTGTIGIIASNNANKVLGVELNRDAVRDAVANAKINNVKNIYFECGDAGEVLKDLSDGGVKPDVVIMDPPRAGASREFLQALASVKPDRLVYISCNPQTLARDLEYLTKKGYRAKAIQPVDMFPFTRHVESVVLMSRAGSRLQVECIKDKAETKENI